MIKKEEKQERTAIEEEEDEVENDEIMINENMDINNYNIYFYLLEKNKKDILIEICISLSNKLEKYETINLLNIPVKSEDDYILNLLSNYDFNNYQQPLSDSEIRKFQDNEMKELDKFEEERERIEKEQQ